MTSPLAKIRGEIEANLRVLIVDDEAQIVSALRRELRKESFEIVSFTDPAEALEAIGQQEYSLIISDNLMPGMTGLELLSKAKQSALDTQRFLLTGRTELGDAIQAFNDGILHRFITKPWDKDDLISSIQEALDSYCATRLRRETERLKSFALKKRSEQYDKTLVELKQAQTQLTLREERQDSHAGWFPADLLQLRFLVVEEHDGVREAIKLALEEGGVASVHAVPNGYDALNYLIGSGDINIVLADWGKSQLAGLTLMEAIRGIKELTRQPGFILISTEENKEAVKRAIAAGVDGYIIKPFRMDSLIEQLKNIQQKSRKAPVDKRVQALKELTFLVANERLQARTEIEGLLADIGLQNFISVSSGRSFLRTLREKSIDVVLYDTNLGDPDWPELDEAIIAMDERKSDPVTILTSQYPKRKELRKLRNAGIPYITTPYHRTDFSNVIIKAVLDN